MDYPLLPAIVGASDAWADPDYPPRAQAVGKTLARENRFTAEAVAFAINQQMHAIGRLRLEKWLAGRRAPHSFQVGVLNAGNLPLVDLQDFLAVVLLGHAYLGVVSSRSPYLLPAFADDVSRRDQSLKATFCTADQMFVRSDAIIATGTDETREWVRAQCDAADMPRANRLLRGNRFSVGVLTGSETEDELEALAEDVLLHEGLGCRNVALLWAPEGHSPDALLTSFANFRGVFPAHPRTRGALAMPKAFLEAVGTPHAYGEGLEFLLSKGSPELQQPGHVRWIEYRAVDEVATWVRSHASDVQLVVAREEVLALMPDVVSRERFGQAQRPPVDWCADGTDVVDFLVRLESA